MSILTRPELRVEVAFHSSPFLALDDPALVWTDISPYVEVQQGVSIQARRATELDEPAPSTLSLTLDNTDGRFTRLNTSSPYHPNVKANRLIRVSALSGPSTSVNLVSQHQATGGQADPTSTGFHVPSGTLTAPTGTATATSSGTTTTLRCADADASDIEVGDVVTLTGSASTYRAVTGMSSSAGTTTITFTPAADVATGIGDVATRYRIQWDTGLQAVAGARLSIGSYDTTTAGPESIPVTAGLAYTWSAWVKRGANAASVSPRILWFDAAGALLSESTGSTTALTTSLQRLSTTATAPVGAERARPAIANETVFLPAPVVGFRAAATAKSSTTATPGSLRITQPASVRAGDGLLLVVTVDSASATVTTPSGWTAVSDRVGAGSRSYLFRKVATSTDAGSVIVISSTGTKPAGIYLAYSGTDTTNPVHKSASAAETVYRTTHTTPNVTTTVAGCWVISAVCDRNSTTGLYTVPAGDTSRAAVYNTGAGATVGAVSDNAATVVAGTYGSKVWTANKSSEDATMWTVAVSPAAAAGSSSGSVSVTGLQLEQAASVSAWAVPPKVYPRFVGHVDSWPTHWEGGVRALTTITATDRQKALSDGTVRAAVTEQTLSTDPIAYYPLSEESDATAAANAAATTQPSLPIVSRGTVTDEMLQFGAGTGPGTDGQTALVLAPTSSTVGKGLRGRLTSQLGGTGVTAMTIAAVFKSTSTGNWNHTLVGADDGNNTDGGAVDGLFDIYANPTAPHLRVRLRMPDGEQVRTSTTNWFDGETHMVVAAADLSEGGVALYLYVDGVPQGTFGFPDSPFTEFPSLPDANIGCGTADAIQNLYSGTISHVGFWNYRLSSAEITDLWAAAEDGFAGDLPGVRAGRIAAWGGLISTAFDTGEEPLLGHPSTEMTHQDALKLIAKTEGGPFFLDREGRATIHARSRRVNTVSSFSIHASAIDGDMRWVEDPLLIANKVTVKYGENEVTTSDQASQDDYGTQAPEPLETLLADDTRAIQRADAYLSRYREPISRPDPVSIEALLYPEHLADLLAAGIGTKFTVTDLPVGAPAAAADLFVEGVGEDINHESWKVTLDCSPAGFDFGLILDDTVRGLLDSNYVGF